MSSTKIRLTPTETKELHRRLRSRSIAVAEARRAQIILLLAQGHSFASIRRQVSCTDRSINTWKQRFLGQRLPGLASRYRGRAPHPKSAQTQARILAAMRHPPRDGTTHWSTRRLARHLGTSHSAIARTWRAAGLQPHAMRRYMASNDPRFQAKAADIIGLYLQPPAHAAVFCVDEKSAIQALDRLDPVLPLSPGRAERHGFEYRSLLPFAGPTKTHAVASHPLYIQSIRGTSAAAVFAVSPALSRVISVFDVFAPLASATSRLPFSTSHANSLRFVFSLSAR